MMAFLLATAMAGGGPPAGFLPEPSKAETPAATPDAGVLLVNATLRPAGRTVALPPTLGGIRRGPVGDKAALWLRGRTERLFRNEAEARAYFANDGLAPRVIDCAGRGVVLGLTDAHGHIQGLGFYLERLKLVGTTSAEEVAKRVAEAAKSRAAGAWILGRGWDQNDWVKKDFPDRALLDRAAREQPVFLTRVDGHAGWANSAALAKAGVTAATQEPDGGKIYRDGSGEPTGILVDNAMDLVRKMIPKPTRDEKRAAIVRGARECARWGLTRVHDAGMDAEDVSIYRELAEKGELPIRVRGMLSAERASDVEKLLTAEKIRAGDGQFRIFGVKAYADGALGSRGAALLAPYADDPKNSGLLLAKPEELTQLARLCLERGYQLCVHAIGDRGNRMVLDCFEAAAAGDLERLRAARFRIEHAQVIALEDIPRFAELGVIGSMQPTHCTSDMPWAPERLGPERVKGAYAWRRLLTAGASLAFGSDFPIEEVNPALGIHAAVTTQQADGKPPLGFREDEKLSLDETLRAFTEGAAFAVFDEGLGGDATVFDRDPEVIPSAQLHALRPIVTVVGGRVVYEGTR